MPPKAVLLSAHLHSSPGPLCLIFDPRNCLGRIREKGGSNWREHKIKAFVIPFGNSAKAESREGDPHFFLEQGLHCSQLQGGEGGPQRENPPTAL